MANYQLTPLMLKGVPSAKSFPSRDSKLISQCASPLQVSCQAVDMCTTPRPCCPPPRGARGARPRAAERGRAEEAGEEG